MFFLWICKSLWEFDGILLDVDGILLDVDGIFMLFFVFLMDL